MQRSFVHPLQLVDADPLLGEQTILNEKCYRYVLREY